MEHDEKMRLWYEGGQVGPEPKPPPKVVPAPLALWIEIEMFDKQQLLVAGGLMDQPDWVWDLVIIAGTVYRSETVKKVVINPNAKEPPLKMPSLRGTS